MKRLSLRMIAFFLLGIMTLSFVSCNSTNTPSETTTATQALPSTTEPTVVDETTTSSPGISPETTTSAPDASTETTTVPEETTTSGAVDTPTPQSYPWAETPTTLKVLAIGNSFSTDAMQYLYDIAKSAGVKEIVLGNLYIGGCNLATHLVHAKADDGAYIYYKNTSGKWTSTSSTKFSTGLTDEKWDIITMQQSSPLSGITSSYKNTLQSLINIVNEKKTNPDARLFWHMTWAYQSDSTHSAFPDYGRDQMKMYNMIVAATEECVLPLFPLSNVIPGGTAIQNARTSFVGDHITRDGYHMNYTLGRYLLGLTWYAALTGADISDIAYFPAVDITPEVMAMAKASVRDAMNERLKITESTHKSGTWSANTSANSTQVVLAADCFEADRNAAQSIGVDLTKYKLLEYDYFENAFYYCTQGSAIKVPATTASTYHQNICTKKIYSKDEIPENSIIICDSGWQYRPEMWTDLNQKAATRPSMTTTMITKLDATFWGANKYIALNIASAPKTDISAYYAAAASHVRIYVPVS